LRYPVYSGNLVKQISFLSYFVMVSSFQQPVLLLVWPLWKWACAALEIQ